MATQETTVWKADSNNIYERFIEQLDEAISGEKELTEGDQDTRYALKLQQERLAQKGVKFRCKITPRGFMSDDKSLTRKWRDRHYISEAAYHDYYGRVVAFQHPVNVGWSYNAGGEFTMTYRPNGMFNLRFYANLYDSYIETDYGVGEVLVQNRMLCYSFRMNLWSKLWNRLEVHASTSPGFL